jgi:hypothetical protein
MLASEKRLRALIREVLITEVSDENLSIPPSDRLKNLALPQEYQGILDPTSKDFILNPASALEKMRNDPAVQRASEEIASELSNIPVIGTPFTVTSTIFSALKGDYAKAAVSLSIAIIETAIGHFLGGWIASTFKPVAMGGGRVAARTLVFQVSTAVELLSNHVLNGLQDAINTALDAAKVSDPVKRKEISEGIKSQASPALVKDLSAAAVMKEIKALGVVIPSGEEMEAEWRPGE